MTLEQIRYFIAAADLGSFSAAGQHLYVSHSSVSRGVAALEEEFGIALMIREKKNLRLTQAGEIVYRQGQDLMQQARRLTDSVAAFSSRRTLHVTCIGVYIPRFYELMREFQNTHLDIEINIEQVSQQMVTRRLTAGETDLILNFSFLWTQDPDLEYMKIEHGSFRALVSPGHPLATRPYLTREDLDGRPDLLGENPFSTDPPRDAEEPWDVPSIVLKSNPAEPLPCCRSTRYPNWAAAASACPSAAKCNPTT